MDVEFNNRRMMEFRENKEALRKEFSQINNDCFEVFNDWGSTDPTWNYTHWLENKLLSINTPKHETVEDCENIKVDSFLNDIKAVMEKHKLTIAHEDIRGGFIIQDFNKHNVDWLMGASMDVESK